MYQQTYNIVPSAYGFKSIRPRSRVERKNSNDKVALEKNRINMRVGINARIQRANAPETSAGLTTCDTTGAGYISNVHRFHSDTCGDEMLRRKQELLAKSRGVQYRQHQNEQRDAIRWQREDDNNRREEQYWQGVRDTGEGCPKNLSAVGYDITSLAYHNDLKGDCAKYEDDMSKILSALCALSFCI